MKRVLIISPHFPPTNAADMHRVRMSLPYFEKYGWEAEVVTVEERFVEIVKDPLLLESIPNHIPIHKVKALSRKYTSKLGLGSLALRSMWFYRQKVDLLCKQKHFDLIYFSTTEFPICILGAHWKKKFGIPYLIDMQDPWFSDYYHDKPKHERPKKYWFSYRLHKYLEPIAMRQADGIISVSADYIEILKQRYSNLKDKPQSVITFGAHEIDFEIAQANDNQLKLAYKRSTDQINLIYIGRGGFDMKVSIEVLFNGFKKALKNDPKLYGKVHFHFIGTSYAPKGQGTLTVAPIANSLGISNFVTEYTDRIGFYDSIKNLKSADGLFIIGSNSSAYTASKLYPYILARKQILAILHPQSSAAYIFNKCKAGELITLEQNEDEAAHIFQLFINKIRDNREPTTDWTAFESFTASFLTYQQVQVFNQILGLK